MSNWLELHKRFPSSVGIANIYTPLFDYVLISQLYLPDLETLYDAHYGYQQTFWYPTAIRTSPVSAQLRPNSFTAANPPRVGPESGPS